MFDYLKYLYKKKFIETQYAKNNFTVLNSDIFLTSYPRSGNTWMRFMLSTLKTGEKQSFHSIDNQIPSPWLFTDNDLLNKFDQPRIIKTHDSYKKEYKKIIFIIRDPRDVAISFYYWRYRKGFFENSKVAIGLKAYLYQFLEMEAGGFVNWGDHTESWLDKKDDIGENNFITTRYEDLHKDTAKELSRISNFIGWDKSAKEIKFAIDNSKPDKMRSTERKHKKGNSGRFVRKAKADQWKDVFDKHLNDEYIKVYGKWIEYFGYDKNF